MNQQVEQNTNKNETRGCTCCAVGCGIPLILGLGLFLLLRYEVTREEFGENKTKAPMFNAEKGSN